MLMEHGVRCKQFAEGFNQLLLQQAEKVVVAFFGSIGWFERRAIGLFV